MINFKDYLTEARDFPIYHGTENYIFEHIINYGIAPKSLQRAEKLLLPKETADKTFKHNINGNILKSYNYYGISTTREFRFAANWSKQGVVIELNHIVIASRYKILPIQFFPLETSRIKFGAAGAANEYEEFIVTTRAIPINSTFVKKIWFCDKSDYNTQIVPKDIEIGYWDSNTFKKMANANI